MRARLPPPRLIWEVEISPKSSVSILHKGMDKDTLVQLVERGLTIPEIAIEINKSPSQICRLLKKCGLKTKWFCNHDPSAKTRVCRYCYQPQSIECFAVANVINGEVYRRWRCDACYAQMKKERRIKIRSWFQEYKKGCQCKCGESDFRLLDFHHLDDTKEANVSSVVSNGRWSIKRIKGEIAKCECLCVKCHRLLHYEERFGV